jgi:hypothetical protein
MLMTLATDTARIPAGCDVTLLLPRNYDTTLGRFISFDTFEGYRGDPLTLQRYVYGANDPVNNIDPSGHTTKEQGKSAHKIISAIYKLDHQNAVVDISIKPYSGGKKLLADIINYTGETVDTGLLAEIKTPGEAKEGDTQLAGYLNQYNALRVNNSTWLRDSFWNPTIKAFWLGVVDPNNPEFKDTFGFIVGNNNGVIVYDTFDRRGPRPQPDPIPVPLEVVEKITDDVYNNNFDTTNPEPVFALPREIVIETVLASAGLGTAILLARAAVPAIAGYLAVGEATTTMVSFA